VASPPHTSRRVRSIESAFVLGTDMPA
jgi:hypothetical protein